MRVMANHDVHSTPQRQRECLLPRSAALRASSRISHRLLDIPSTDNRLTHSFNMRCKFIECCNFD